jgi:RNA polymerase sigma factor (sigma-70 family)
MASTLLHTLLGYLRRLDQVGSDTDSDAVLLRRFQAHDETAFATLLARHGPMVLAVCRRLLHQEQEAEDAFQATFLVMARKARSLNAMTSVGGWLHGVAVHVCRKAREQRLRRERLLRESVERAVPRNENIRIQEDVMVALEEELDRLPSRYKQPLILCHLESKNVDEAAQELGWSQGTVRGRLYRARELLRNRLARRGLTTTENARAMGCVPVPAGLVQATVGMAQGSALGAGPAFVLAQGVLRAMMLTRVIVLAGALTLVGLGAVGTLALAPGQDIQPTKEPPKTQPIPAEKGKTEEEKANEKKRAELEDAVTKGEPPPLLKTQPVEEAPGDDKLTKLLKRRYNASLELTKASYLQYVTGKIPLDLLVNAARRLATAGGEIHSQPAKKLAFLKLLEEVATYVEMSSDAGFNGGRAAVLDVLTAREFKLEVEIMILKLEGK